MAKMTLGKLAGPSFTMAMQLLLGKEMKATTAYKIKGLIEKFNGELKKFGDLRKEIIERRCKKGEDGKPLLDDKQSYSFDDGVMKEVEKEMNDLTGIEVEFTPIKLADLTDSKGKELDLTAQNMFDLGEVIDAT